MPVPLMLTAATTADGIGRWRIEEGVTSTGRNSCQKRLANCLYGGKNTTFTIRGRCQARVRYFAGATMRIAKRPPGRRCPTAPSQMEVRLFFFAPLALPKVERVHVWQNYNEKNWFSRPTSHRSYSVTQGVGARV